MMREADPIETLVAAFILGPMLAWYFHSYPAPNWVVVLVCVVTLTVLNMVFMVRDAWRERESA